MKDDLSILKGGKFCAGTRGWIYANAGSSLIIDNNDSLIPGTIIGAFVKLVNVQDLGTV